jgi:hypothetical protein
MNVLDWPSAARIYEDLTASCHGADDLERLRIDVVSAAVAYTRYRATWGAWDLEERRRADADRRIAHDAFIDALDMLSRAVASTGGDNSWRARLGDARADLGDFANFVVLFEALRSG